MNAARSLRYQRSYVIFVVAAMLALVQPLITPLAPQLAGWLPGHQHVYVNGVPVDHAHPWDGAGEAVSALDEAPAGYVFHLCDIHPEGWVPVGPSSSASTGDAPSGSVAGNAETDADEVLFTFDLGMSAAALPGLSADLTTCGGAPVLASERAAVPVTAPSEHPLSPPPRV